MVRVTEIKGVRVKITIIGNIIMPDFRSWVYGYRHVTSAIFKNKPIPKNVIYFEEYLENEVEDLY